MEQNIPILDVADTIYPAIISAEMRDGFILTRPLDSDIYLVIFVLLSFSPMLFSVEKNILQKKTPIVLLNTICVIFFIGIIGLDALSVSGHFFNLYINYVFLFGWVMLVITAFRIIYVYLKLAISSVGEIRVLGALMCLGLVLMVTGLVLTSTISDLTDFSEIIGHGIQLTGLVLIFFGVMKMQ